MAENEVRAQQALAMIDAANRVNERIKGLYRLNPTLVREFIGPMSAETREAMKAIDENRRRAAINMHRILLD